MHFMYFVSCFFMLKNRERNMKYEFIRNYKFNHIRLVKTSYIKNADFSLNKGEHVGIVGQNGTGKSTLIKLCNGSVASR